MSSVEIFEQKYLNILRYIRNRLVENRRPVEFKSIWQMNKIILRNTGRANEEEKLTYTFDMQEKIVFVILFGKWMHEFLIIYS